MRFQNYRGVPLFLQYSLLRRRLHHRPLNSYFVEKVKSPSRLRAFFTGGNGDSQGNNTFLLPGATVATLAMLGLLHARRMYDDKKVEGMRERGTEIAFQTDFNARFLRCLPLRSISRIWGSLTSTELPVWLRPHVYRSWARAFHSNLEEIDRPLDEYVSLREFFVRALKEGSRPVDPNIRCLVSPVDGTVLRFGELKGVGGMIEQVKGFSYSVSSLLGSTSSLPMVTEGNMHGKNTEQEGCLVGEQNKKSRWNISFASPKVQGNDSVCPVKGLYYCVIYLRPGDYHRIHSPVDWNILVRRHFSGRLFPVNERATRTFRNLYIENERVVLEGMWREGFMAIAAVGSTNTGSIKLFIEPDLMTNRPGKKLLHFDPPAERQYDPEGKKGIVLNKGDEVAAFNMGSTVVIVFQAPSRADVDTPGFEFCIRRGDRVRVGEALGTVN